MKISHQGNPLPMLESHDQDCSRIISSVYLGAFFNEKMVPVTTFSSRTANVAIKVFLSEEKKKTIIFMLLGALEA